MSTIVSTIRNAMNNTAKMLNFVKDKVSAKCNKKSRRRNTMKKVKKPKMKGGDGWQHTVATYGGIGEQHASASSNVIAATDVSVKAAATPAPEVKGGKSKNSNTSMKSKKIKI